MGFKIFETVIKCSPKQAFEILSNSKYSVEKPMGFEITEFYNSQISGVFYYKSMYDEVLIDPSGDTITNQYIIIQKYRFMILQDIGLLIVIDSPRNLNVFFSALSEAFSNNIIIDTVNMDLLKFSELLKHFFSNQYVSSVEITGLSFSQKISYRVNLSGVVSVLEYIEKATYGSTEYQIKKIGVSFLVSDKSSRIEVSANGKFLLPEREKTFIQRKIFEALKLYFSN